MADHAAAISGKDKALSQVQAVAVEFCDPVCAGRIEFEGKYELCLDKLEVAGTQAIVDEGRRPIDEWMATELSSPGTRLRAHRALCTLFLCLARS